MANLQLTDCAYPTITLKASLNTQQRRYRTSQARFTPKASSVNHNGHQQSVTRRLFIAETAAAVSISVSPLLGFEQQAKAEEALSEWERVFLPIDPGVVLLDIAFVPDDLNHGQFCWISLEYSLSLSYFYPMLVVIYLRLTFLLETNEFT